MRIEKSLILLSLTTVFLLGTFAFAQEVEIEDANGLSRREIIQMRKEAMRARAQERDAKDGDIEEDKSIPPIDGIDDDFNKSREHGRRFSAELQQDNIEDRVKLAKSVESQAVSELSLLRKLASEEGASKTVEAIDYLISQRRQQFRDLARRIEERKHAGAVDEAGVVIERPIRPSRPERVERPVRPERPERPDRVTPQQRAREIRKRTQE